jgi:hypothetical protein
VSVVPASGSLPTTVVTAVVFSGMLTVAVALPPLLVMTGGSLTFVTVTATGWLVTSEPSDAWTVTL